MADGSRALDSAMRVIGKLKIAALISIANLRVLQPRSSDPNAQHAYQMGTRVVISIE